MSNRLDLYTINNHYGNFLHGRDTKSPDVSGRKARRPFIGVMIIVNDKEYIVPLTSPKEKHQRMKNTIDFMKIDSGKLGAINFNNMVPVDRSLCERIIIQHESNPQYKELLNNQYNWIKQNQDAINKKAQNLYNKYIEDRLPDDIKSRCVDFPRLEKALDTYLQRQPNENTNEISR